VSNLRFIFYGGAREFAKHHGHEAIIHGPAETGKTISALWKLHLIANKYDNASIVIARKTQTSIYGTVLETYKNKVLQGKPEAWGKFGIGIKPYGGDNKPEWFDYNASGSRIWLAGLDKAGKILSAEHDIVYVNQVEELTLGDWETITTRTTGRAGHVPYSQTIGDANPAYPTHWMYRRASLRLFYSKHEENPELFYQFPDPRAGEITEQGKRTMAVLDALTGVRKQRLRYGKAAQAEGAIYTEYDEAIHRVYANQAPKRYARYVAAVDWGYRHAGAIGVLGLTGDGVMYLVAQLYHTGRRDDWWKDRAVELNEEFGIEAFACDPSQPAYIDKFKDAGLNAFGADNAVIPGINAVKKRLAEKRLFLVRDSLRQPDQTLIEAQKPHQIEDELPAYVWATKGKEMPVKENDDGVDMLRYAIMHVDGRPSTKIVRAWGPGRR